jgi:hypothetical protein
MRFANSAGYTINIFEFEFPTETGRVCKSTTVGMAQSFEIRLLGGTSRFRPKPKRCRFLRSLF